MPIYGWIHIVKSRKQALALLDAINTFSPNRKNIFLEYFAILDGALLTKDGRIFGDENKKSLVIMTNSVGADVIDTFIEKGLINKEDTVCLDDLYEDEFIEDYKYGLFIWSATYISREKFLRKLKK